MKDPRVFEKFIRAVKAHALLDRGDRLVVAVSGGADSVALLSLLLEVRAQFELDLIVAHLNHNLRGSSSDEDQEFVRTLAHRFGIRFICEKIESEAVVSRKENLESWARTQRYAFLSRIAGDVRAQEVALGHTMSDQAETFLMRLFRGSGTVGLSAMAHKRDNFIRPLLTIERHEILAYLKVRGITWREDASNSDTRFLRNRLRQELIPNLKDAYNPKIVALLAGTAAIVREESEALQLWALEIFAREARVDGNKVTWDINSLVSLPVGLQKRLIRLSFERLVPGTTGLSAQNVASIIHLLGKRRSGKFIQTGAFSCFREFNRLRLEAVQPVAPRKFCYALRIPGRVALPQTDTCFEARFEPSLEDVVVVNRWELFLSKTEMEAGFYVRNWEPADVYSQPGSDSPKRVTSLFAQRKIPRRCRNSWPVVVLKHRVVCVKDFPFSADNPVQGREKTRVVIEERSQDL